MSESPDRPAAPWLFHRANALYEPGDQIPPGNWGRLVLGIGPAHPLYFREYLWERIRRAEFPTKPSRMRACFAFEAVEAADKFVQNRDWPTYTYAVRLTDATLPLHRGDTSWLEPSLIQEFRTFEGVEGCARHYWNSDERSSGQFEIVVSGALEVVQRLTPIRENGHG